MVKQGSDGQGKDGGIAVSVAASPGPNLPVFEFNEAIALADNLEDLAIQNLSASTRIGGKFDLVTVAIGTAYAPICS